MLRHPAPIPLPRRAPRPPWCGAIPARSDLAAPCRPPRPGSPRRPLRALVRGLASSLLLVLVAIAAGPPAALAAGRVYRNEAFRILALEIPRGWSQAPQITWPRVLVLASGGGRSAGARLVVTAQKVIPGQDALSLAAAARAALLQQRFRDPRVSDRSPGTGGESRAQIDGFYDPEDGKGTLVLRQLYVVSGDVAVVLTVTAPTAAATSALADFTLAAESLVIAPLPLAPAPDGASDGGGGASSTKAEPPPPAGRT